MADTCRRSNGIGRIGLIGLIGRETVRGEPRAAREAADTRKTNGRRGQAPAVRHFCLLRHLIRRLSVTCPEI